MMRSIPILILLGLLLVPALARAAEPPAAPVEDNRLVRAIFDADQADRSDERPGVDEASVRSRDKARRDQMLELVKSGQLRTANDYFLAGIIFQHSLDDLPLAHALATIAHYIDPDNKRNSWLMAASLDRMMVQRHQPQWYGTQYQSNDKGLFLYPVADGVVSDAERIDAGIPTLEEARAKVAVMAKEMGISAAPDAPTIEDLRAEARPAKPANSKSQAKTEN